MRTIATLIAGLLLACAAPSSLLRETELHRDQALRHPSSIDYVSQYAGTVLGAIDGTRYETLGARQAKPHGELAIALLSKLLDQNEELEARHWHMRGRLCEAFSRPTCAIADYRRTIDLATGNTQRLGYESLARILVRHGRLFALESLCVEMRRTADDGRRLFTAIEICLPHLSGGTWARPGDTRWYQVEQARREARRQQHHEADEAIFDRLSCISDCVESLGFTDASTFSYRVSSNLCQDTCGDL